MPFLGELIEIKGGGTPSKKVPEYWGGSIPWASVKDFKSSVLSSTADSITDLGVENSATSVIPAGTIVVPTRMALGKVAITAVDMAINQDLKALLINNEQVLDKNYLLRFLESQAGEIEKHGKGATVKGITLDVLRGLEIPLPPLAEQKRIAAILDKADALRRKRQQAIDFADQFLRSVFLEMFGDPVTNPKGWEVKNISEACLEIVDCVNRTAPVVDYETPYKMIRTTNVRNYEIDLSTVRYVEKESYEKWTRRLLPMKGDIVFTREAPAGEAGIIETAELVFLGQRTMHFRPDFSKVTSEFLLFELMGSGIKNQISRMSTGSTVKHLSVPECKKFNIRMPPIEVQKRFSVVVKQLKESRSGFLTSQKCINEYFNSVSQQAFSGEL